MKRTNIFIILFLGFSLMLQANEGMWMPSLLGKYTLTEMEKAGFRLSKEDIYNINEASLKDAILGMASSSSPTSFFGTASFISETGLAITNHHLGLKYIQNHSTTARNYVRDGFLAASPEEELPAENMTLARLVRIDDVTEEITEGFENMAPGQQDYLLNERGKELASRNNEDGKYKVVIKSYFSGNQYFMEVYEFFNQVKIVAIPPMSVAKFGG
ncbi:MAG: S46 family peptidase, partial [Bacteroidales bacterium]